MYSQMIYYSSLTHCTMSFGTFNQNRNNLGIRCDTSEGRAPFFHTSDPIDRVEIDELETRVRIFKSKKILFILIYRYENNRMFINYESVEETVKASFIRVRGMRPLCCSSSASKNKSRCSSVRSWIPKSFNAHFTSSRSS